MQAMWPSGAEEGEFIYTVRSKGLPRPPPPKTQKTDSETVADIPGIVNDFFGSLFDLSLWLAGLCP